MRSDRQLTRETEIVARYLNGETMQEIGGCYGVSRERIRQLLKRHNLIGLRDKPATRSVKCVPFNANDPRWRYAWSSAGEAWWSRHHQTKPIRRTQVAKLREWVRETGRTDPTIAETLAIVGERFVSVLAIQWGRHRRHGPYTRYLDRLRKLCGVVARSRGTKGHRSPLGKGRRWAASLAFDAKVRPLLDNGMGAAEIARIIGAKRTTVWVSMQRLRRDNATA